MKAEEIKKKLYIQKPIAEYGYNRSGVWNYSTEIVVDGIEEIVEFFVPVSEMGEKEFEKEMPAQLLIRWLAL